MEEASGDDDRRVPRAAAVPRPRLHVVALTAEVGTGSQQNS